MMWFRNDKLPKMTEDETKMYNVITNLIIQPDCIIEVNPENMDYMLCLENKFLEDVKKKAPFKIFNKIKEIHNKIIH